MRWARASKCRSRGRWTGCRSGRACAELGELRAVAALDGAARRERLRELGARLRLQHLPTFFERMTARRA